MTSSGERRAALDGPMVEGLVTSILARSAAMAGDHARAHELFLEACEHDRSIGIAEWVVETLADDVTSLVALGELEHAGRALDELHTTGSSLSSQMRSSAAALEARARGLVAAARGDLETAIAFLERSRDELEAAPTPWPYERCSHSDRCNGAFA